jgi:hypothetical protein
VASCLQLYHRKVAAPLLKWGVYVGRMLSDPEGARIVKCLREYLPYADAEWAMRQMRRCELPFLNYLEDEWAPPTVRLSQFKYEGAAVAESTGSLGATIIPLGTGTLDAVMHGIWEASGNEERKREDIEWADLIVRKWLVTKGGFVMHCTHRAVMQLSHGTLARFACGYELEEHQNLPEQIRGGYAVVPDRGKQADDWQTVLAAKDLPGDDLPAWAQPGSTNEQVAAGYQKVFGAAEAGAAFLALQCTGRVKGRKQEQPQSPASVAPTQRRQGAAGSLAEGSVSPAPSGRRSSAGSGTGGQGLRA